jgi:hypothetical protein
MFLLAARGHMLPGLVLHSLVEVTCGILVDVWFHGARNGHHSTASAAKEELAMAILLRLRRQKTSEIGENASSHLIFVATGIARSLVKAGTRGSVVSMPDPLELISSTCGWINLCMQAPEAERIPTSSSSAVVVSSQPSSGLWHNMPAHIASVQIEGHFASVKFLRGLMTVTLVLMSSLMMTVTLVLTSNRVAMGSNLDDHDDDMLRMCGSST